MSANSQPFFQGVRFMTVYASSSGSDSTGNGSSNFPYRTFARCVKRVLTEVGTTIPPGLYVTIDITNLGTETLANDFVMPAFRGPSTPTITTDPYWQFLNALNIKATPKLTVAVPAADAQISLAEIVGTTADPVTGLLAIQTTKTWVAGDLKGKFLHGAGVQENAVIYDNTTDTIYVTTSDAPTAPLKIMEPSAKLQGGQTLQGIHGNPGTSGLHGVSWQGIDLRSSAFFCAFSSWGSYNFFEFCLFHSPFFYNPLRQTFLYYCDVEQPSISFNCEVYNHNCRLHEALFGICFQRPANVQFYSIETVFDSIGDVVVYDAAVGELKLEQNTLLDSCLIIGGGYEFNGGRARLVNVLIKDAPSYAVAARMGHGVLELENVQQTGAVDGAILVNDGCHVKVDGDSFTGVGDSMDVGDLATRTFTDFRGSAPTKQQYDLTAVAAGGATGTGSRVYQD